MPTTTSALSTPTCSGARKRWTSPRRCARSRSRRARAGAAHRARLRPGRATLPWKAGSPGRRRPGADRDRRLKGSSRPDANGHWLARPVRLERTAFGSGGQRSIQLSYGREDEARQPRDPATIAAIPTARSAGCGCCRRRPVRWIVRTHSALAARRHHALGHRRCRHCKQSSSCGSSIPMPMSRPPLVVMALPPRRVGDSAEQPAKPWRHPQARCAAHRR